MRMNPQTPALLEVESLRFSYGRSLIKDINFKIKAGEVFCLLGPSGTGKSTLLRLIAGLEQCQEGRILLDGKVVSDCHYHLSPHKRGVAMVFQDYGLFPHLSAYKNIELAIRGNGPQGYTRREVVREALALTEMEHLKDVPCQLLSGGEQQRVALARAIAVYPRLILLDEPFSNLDMRMRETIRSRSLQLIRRYGISALLVTHDAEEARLLSDRMAVLQYGSIQQCGTPDELYDVPKHAGVANILGYANTIEVVGREGQVHTPLGTFSYSSTDDSRTTKKGSHELDCIIRYEDVEIGEESIPRELSAHPSARITNVQHLGRVTRVDCHIPYQGKEEGWWLHAQIPRNNGIKIGQWRRIGVLAYRLCPVSHEK